MGIKIDYQAERCLNRSVYAERRQVKERKAALQKRQELAAECAADGRLQEKLKGVIVTISPESREYRKESQSRN